MSHIIIYVPYCIPYRELLSYGWSIWRIIELCRKWILLDIFHEFWLLNIVDNS